jgi:hypothetical protein
MQRNYDDHLLDYEAPALQLCKSRAQRLGQPRHRKTTHFLGKTG